MTDVWHQFNSGPDQKSVTEKELNSPMAQLPTYKIAKKACL